MRHDIAQPKDLEDIWGWQGALPMETSSISIQPINTTKVYMPQCDAFAPAASVAVNFEEIRLPA